MDEGLPIINDGTVQRNSRAEMGEDISPALASRLKDYWFEHSTDYSTRKSIYDEYRLPRNCDSMTVPTVNKEVSKMSSFTSYHRRTDDGTKEVQYLLNKSLQVIMNLADGSITADKNNVVIGVKDIVKKSMDAVVLLGHANAKLSNKRRTGLKKIFNPESQSICDNNTAAMNRSKHLFGDDFSKVI